MNDLYFEDFQPGQTFTSRAETMTRERIVSYAAEFDPQSQHLDEAQAASSQVGELIASGWHTASLTMRLQHEAALGRVVGGLGTAIDKLTWLRPVKPGDSLHARIEITGTHPSPAQPDRGVVTFLTTTIDQNGEPVQTMLGTVIASRRAQV